MIKALLHGSRSGTAVLLGLSDGNLVRLRAGMPILLDLAELGLPRQPVVVMHGTAEDAIREEVARSGGRLRQVVESAADGDQPPPAAPTDADYAAATAALEALLEETRDLPGLAKACLDAAYAARWNVWAGGRAFCCPRCLAVSHHPDDAANGYCGACHDFTAPRQALPG